jgi:hypothetical protein
MQSLDSVSLSQHHSYAYLITNAVECIPILTFTSSEHMRFMHTVTLSALYTDTTATILYCTHTTTLSLLTTAPPLPGLGKLQTFLCVTYVGTDAVVGCSSGELYRFSGRQLVQVVQVSAPLRYYCKNHSIHSYSIHAVETLLCKVLVMPDICYCLQL